ncbi:MAG TPA: hypothetical protein VEO01_03645, partial [Pseudonocardiaceae bacterium]|nr:hypothetical protein [Pseudonocardiaceae bacterium]
MTAGPRPEHSEQPPAGSTGERRRRFGMLAGLLVLAGSAALWAPALVRGGAGATHIDPVARFLLALAVILVLSHLLGALLRK